MMPRFLRACRSHVSTKRADGPELAASVSPAGSADELGDSDLLQHSSSGIKSMASKVRCEALTCIE